MYGRIKYRIVKKIYAGAKIKYHIEFKTMSLFPWGDAQAVFDNLNDAMKLIYDLKRDDIDVYQFNKTVNK